MSDTEKDKLAAEGYLWVGSQEAYIKAWTPCETYGHWWAFLRTLHKEQVVDVFYCQRCLEYKERPYA